VSSIDGIADRPGFEYVQHDVTEPLPLDGLLEAVVRFASPGSPPDYLALPIDTLEVGSTGTRLTLDLARAKGARYLLASTGEIYGNPLVHLQTEDYWGDDNPAGPLSVYDQAKRFGEALAMAYRWTHGLDVKIVRIFNTYGPGVRPGDGRAIPNFVAQALAGQPLTAYGDGSQTRSFCYVDDEVRGILARALSECAGGPVNIGNPEEHSILRLAELVVDLTGSDSRIEFETLAENDLTTQRPDITLAGQRLGWKRNIGLAEGLQRTIDRFRSGANG
jgi:dTDP-glucose 4,6-dehydratase